MVANGIILQLIPKVTPYNGSLTTSHEYNSIAQYACESVVIMPTCEVTYEMGIFDINIHFLYGHPEAIEKTIALLYESFRLFCARYEQYLTFEVEASHDSNCNFLFNSKQDCIGSLTNPLCTFRRMIVPLYYCK